MEMSISPFEKASVFIFSKDLQILTTSRHLIHFNLQIALGLTQIVFLAGGTATHNEVGNLFHFLVTRKFMALFLGIYVV
jgi:hypothetical protein